VKKCKKVAFTKNRESKFYLHAIRKSGGI